MNSWYAVIASLPYLKWGDRPPMDATQFDQWVANSLEPRLLHELQAALGTDSSQNSSPTIPGIFKTWQRFNRQLRLALASERQKRLAWPVNPDWETSDPGLQNQARLALDQANPLECERAIELARWNFLEMAGQGHYFDISALVCWWLKLAILWRLDKFREPAGQGAFARHHNQIAISIAEFYQKAGAS